MRSSCTLQPPRQPGDSRSLRSTTSHTFAGPNTHALRRSWACFICKRPTFAPSLFARLYVLHPLLYLPIFPSYFSLCHKYKRKGDCVQFVDRTNRLFFAVVVERKDVRMNQIDPETPSGGFFCR